MESTGNIDSRITQRAIAQIIAEIDKSASRLLEHPQTATATSSRVIESKDDTGRSPFNT